MVSFVVLVRVYELEKPYLHQFIEYYLNFIKADRIYFLVTDKTDFSKFIKEEYLDRIILIQNKETVEKHPHNIFMHGLNEIKKNNEDYFISVDIDEFLFLKKDIRDFLAENSKYNIIKIKWLFSCSSKLLNNDVKDITKEYGYSIFKTQYKPIGKVSEIGGFKGCHELIVQKGIKENKLNFDYTTKSDNLPYIIHFASRGLIDILIRTLGQRIKNDTLDNMMYFLQNRNIDFYNIPSRFKILVIQKTFERTKMNIEFPDLLEKIDNDLEIELLHKVIKMDKKYLENMIYNINKKYNLGREMEILKHMNFMQYIDLTNSKNIHPDTDSTEQIRPSILIRKPIKKNIVKLL